MAGVECRRDSVRKTLIGMEDELDVITGTLLKGGDDLPDGIVFLVQISLLPPHHEVSGLRAERCENQRGGEKSRDEPTHSRHSARISLIRAIASSTACSGLMLSVTTRWIAFAQTS